MTKKDFELIAAALLAARPGPEYYGLEDALTEQMDDVAHALADALATTNPKFDRAKFLSACGVAQS